MKESILRKQINIFCRVRLTRCLEPATIERFRQYLLSLADAEIAPPRRRDRHFDWRKVSQESGIEHALLKAKKKDLRSGLLAISRAARTERWISSRFLNGKSGALRKTQLKNPAQCCDHTFIEFPPENQEAWDEAESFSAALCIQMRRHDDTISSLQRAIRAAGGIVSRKTLVNWTSGHNLPRNMQSQQLLHLIERRYRLPQGYFSINIPRFSQKDEISILSRVPRRDLKKYLWHLPYDFAQRSADEQTEILDWIKQTIITGATNYRRYQMEALKTRYGLKFPKSLHQFLSNNLLSPVGLEYVAKESSTLQFDVPFEAPVVLTNEMAALIRFKTSILTAVGFQRTGRWGMEAAIHQIKQFGLLFGALSAPKTGSINGLGVPLSHLSFGLLVFPAIWDWYVRWRERRRGFFTAFEEQMLIACAGLTRPQTGWLRQNPALGFNLKPIPGFVSTADIKDAQNDWSAACDRMCKCADTHLVDIRRVSKVHRDPFEAISPVLDSDSPVGEYRKITDEILRRMPDSARHPLQRAEHIRAFLMLRLGLHLGLRQKNLRQLLLCARNDTPSTESQLAHIKRGEISWSEADKGWQVFVPLIAFKNGHSSFFNGKPYRVVLPDVADLYRYMDEYVSRHRARLLGGAADPQTFFVRTVTRSHSNGAYTQATFYEAWRDIIARFGIFNPYTKRGAIIGLLPHGPHNVRDVLATHLLKRTGSLELASYAIQDTPNTIAKCYGRFHPRDKIALATNALNEIWSAPRAP